MQILRNLSKILMVGKSRKRPNLKSSPANETLIQIHKNLRIRFWSRKIFKKIGYRFEIFSWNSIVCWLDPTKKFPAISGSGFVRFSRLQATQATLILSRIAWILIRIWIRGFLLDPSLMRIRICFERGWPALREVT